MKYIMRLVLVCLGLGLLMACSLHQKSTVDEGGG